MITRKIVAAQLLAYMKHNISISELIEWAEKSIMEGGFETGFEVPVRNTLGRLGAADATSFGLLWEDCEQLMESLGYQVKVEAALVV